jgi:hypothetical protein
MPYIVPFTSIKPPSGNAPSDPPVKLYSTFSVPDVPTLKIVPHPVGPLEV